MPHSNIRPVRMRSLILAGALASGLAVAPVATQAVSAAGTKAPNITDLKVSPNPVVKGHSFKVSFKTTSGGSYVVFYSTGRSGGELLSGKARPGTVTTKRTKLNIVPGTIHIGVDLTSGKKTKRVLTKLVIKR